MSFSHSYSFLVPFIFSSLNISTITIGLNTNNTTSRIFSAGNNTMPNNSLSGGINKITNIKAAETSVASISLELLNIPVLKIDSLLFLTLYTCTNFYKANTQDAIV